MLRIELGLLLGISTLLAGTAFAQPAGVEGDRAGSGRSTGESLPSVGSMLPEISLYDDRGEEFSTKRLRGQYSVLVFGCLT